MVMTRLIQKPWERVLSPLDLDFNSDAFFCSSDVRATAPMSESLVPKHALNTLLLMNHHDGARYRNSQANAKKFHAVLSYCNIVAVVVVEDYSL